VCSPLERAVDGSDRRVRRCSERQPVTDSRHLVRMATASSILLVLLLMGGPTDGRSQLPVFRGAEGFGTRTAAGRGGAVLVVSTLEDSGPGSLRAALATAGPRTVIFERSGTIRLTTGDLLVTEPYLTVAGQTAPSPGITIRGGGIRIQTHDVLVQHVRIRPGDELAPGVYRGNAGAFIVLGREGTSVATSDTFNVVLDHVTASWATDQNMSTWYPVRDITISNSFITEGLRDYNAKNPGQCHACGLLIGEHGIRIAVVRTLFAHHVHRAPEVKGDTQILLVNNVLYDVEDELIDLYDYEKHGPQQAAIIGNVHIPGPSTTAGGLVNALIHLNRNLHPGSQIYQRDNISRRLLVNSVTGFDPIVSVEPSWASAVTALPSAHVESHIKANAGARPGDRDAVDLQIVAQLTARSGRIIDAPHEVGGYPVLDDNLRHLTLPENPSGDHNHDGYTNLEEWLEAFTADVEGRSDRRPAADGARSLLP
jgi:hypothetical protein